VSLCEGNTYTLPWGAVVNSSGTYRDTLRTAMHCDSVVRTIIITVYQPPVVTISKSNDVDCVLGVSKLTATGGGAYSWTPAASLNDPASSHPTASPDRTTLYRVRVTNNAGCSAEDSIEVALSTGDANNGYLVPTAFTPNGDGRNDCFGVPYWGVVKDFSLSIYNRWGAVVFRSTQDSDCWDGTVNGKNVEAGIYVYLIRATTRCGPVLRKGTFLLIR